MKVTKQEILRPKINNIESIETDTLYQRINNDPTTNAAIQCLTELLLRFQSYLISFTNMLCKWVIWKKILLTESMYAV